MCKRCGASLNPSPDTIIAICPYCGYPNPVVGLTSLRDIYIVPSKYDEHSIRHTLFEKLSEKRIYRRIRRRLGIRRIIGRYVPLWVTRVRYRATLKVAYVGLEHREEVKEVEDELFTFVRGRRHIVYPGIEELFNHYKRTRPRAYPLYRIDIKMWKKEGIELLNIDVDKGNIDNIIRQKIIAALVRSVGKGRVITDMSYDLEYIGEPIVILLPLWLVYYTFRGSIYYFIVAGWDGEIIGGIRPSFLLDKLVSSAKIVLFAQLVALYLALAIVIPFFIMALIKGIEVYLAIIVLAVLASYGYIKFLHHVTTSETISVPKVVAQILLAIARANPNIVIVAFTSSISFIMYIMSFIVMLSPFIVSIVFFLLGSGLFIDFTMRTITCTQRIFLPHRSVR